MKSINKVLTTLCAICVLIGFSALTAPEAKAAIWGDFEYTVSNGVCTVTKYNGTDTDVTIPSKMNGITVTQIGNSAFSGNTSITRIVIPDDVTIIGASAFYNCTGLTEIIFPDNITSIGNSALPSSALKVCYADTQTATTITKYGSIVTSPSAFDYRYKKVVDTQGNASLTLVSYRGDDLDITLPASIDGVPIKTIGMGGSNNAILLINSSQATRVVIPDGPETINSYAFVSLKNLTEIVIPESVTSIGESAFLSCTGLEAIEIPEGVVTLGDSVFRGCSALTEIQLPDSVESLGLSAFAYCSSLEIVTLPQSLTELKSYSTAGNIQLFYYCNKLKEIRFPDNIDTISSYTFENIGSSDLRFVCRAGTKTATKLTQAKKYENNRSYPIDLTSPTAPDFLYQQTVVNGAYTLTITGYSGDNPEVTIPATIDEIPVKTIGRGTNVFNQNVTKVVIPEGVKAINDYAFSQCKNLTNLEIGNDVTSIGNSAFSDCSSLSSIDIPEGVVTLEDSVFRGCSALTEIQLPDSVESLGLSAFAYCSSLEIVTLPQSLTELKSYSTAGNIQLFYYCNKLKEIRFPDNIDTISSYTFENIGSSDLRFVCRAGTKTATKLTQAKKYENNRSYPIDLTSPTAPDFLYQQTVVNGAYTLTITGYSGDNPEVTIPATIDEIPVKTIGRGTNVFNQNVTKVVIPEGVKAINDYAFSQCKNLTDLEIGDSVSSIGAGAFSGCTGLTKITLPAGLASLPSLSTAILNGCTSLTAITFPDNLTTIANDAIPTNVQYICHPGSTTATTLSARGSNINLTSPTEPDLRWRQDVDGDGNVNLTLTAYKGTDMKLTIPGFIENYPIVSIKNECFKNNATIERIALPDTLISIGNSTFSGCSALQSVVLPDYLESIGDFAFQNCPQLDGIILPEWLESLGSGTFYNCTGLTSINIPGNIGAINDRPSNSSYGVFQGCTSLGAVSFGSGLTKIGSYAFYGCTGLKDISLPESVTEIGTYAFYSTTSGTLKRIYIPAGVETVGSNAVNGKLTVYCYEDTPGYNWAMSSGHTVKLMDGGVSGRTFALPEDFRLICGESRFIVPQVFPVFEDDVITWNSSDPSVATVQDGTIAALSPGTATITATLGDMSDSLVVTCYVPLDDFEISCEAVYIIQRDTLQLSAIDLQPANASAVFTWSSSNETYATVDQTGLVTAKRQGNTRITVTSDNNIVRECMVHVCYPVSKITFAEESLSVARDGSIAINATVTAGNQTLINKLVSFTSSDDSIATVDDDGNITGVAIGEATITATSQNGVSASCTVLVNCCEDYTPVIDDSKPETCVEDGLTEGMHCGNCGWVHQAQEIIPALGHDWDNVSYIWSDDNAHVTAIRTCKRDDSHLEQESVETTSVLLSSPSQTQMGKTKYTAIFENEAFVTQEKTVETIPALNAMNVLQLPAQLKVIEEEAFTGLPCEAVIIPDSCVSIGSKAFANCKQLLYVKIPASVTQIAEDAFIGCDKLIIDQTH